MMLLLDIGNTHTHAAIANENRILKSRDFRTADVLAGQLPRLLKPFVGRHAFHGAALASVVPHASPLALAALQQFSLQPPIQISPRTLRGVALDYPKPNSIGQDRLANAVAAHHHFGAPSVVVDFGTAVTFDVVSPHGAYIGGIIAPGLAAMTDYLHEKTALLPRIRIREPRRIIGRTTREAMLTGAVHGYRGLVRQLITELREELRAPSLPVIATGGYAPLIASNLPEITAVRPDFTLEGLRLLLLFHTGPDQKLVPSQTTRPIRPHPSTGSRARE